MQKFNILSVILIVCMLFGMVSYAENTTNNQNTNDNGSIEPTTTLQLALDARPVSNEPTHITVGNSTKVGGAFFTDAFGNNTSDIDVRAMLHGYDPIVWETQLTFITDDTVVEKLEKTVNSDGDTVYTVTIADDLTWNEGTPITAADYVFSYVLEASPEFDAIGGDITLLKHIKGYDEYVAKTELRPYKDREHYLYDVNELKGVRLLGKYRYSVTVQKEYLPYFYELSFISLPPCPISVIAPGCEVADDGNGVYIRNIDDEETELRFNEALLEETILDPYYGYLSNPKLTCGPYSLVEYDPDEGRVEFHINEYYNGNFEGVKPVITDITLVEVLPQDMVRKLQDEEIDVINKAVDGEIIRELMQLANGALPESYQIPEGVNESEIEVRAVGMSNYARRGYAYFGVSNGQGPQQFVKVRQALACMFDADQYVRSFLLGFGLTVKGCYGLGQWMIQAAIGNLRPVDLTPEQEAIWDSFTLDGLDDYSYNMDRALRLLVEDGWVLNEKGEPFDAEEDKIRYKRIDEETLMPLSFVFGLTEENEAAKMAAEMLKTEIESLNGELVLKESSFNEILEDHVSDDSGNRKFDLIFMATNFIPAYDPLGSIASFEEYIGSRRNASLSDSELMELAWAMHTTEPMDIQNYELNWIAYQTRYNELLPTIPIYSNVYFDFYSDYLHNYKPGSEANWPFAILYAWWDETPEVEPEIVPIDTPEEEEEIGDDEIIIE